MFNLITDAECPNRKRMKSSKQEDETKGVSDVNTVRPYLLDLVIHRILALLPTKSAFHMSFLSKQWEGVWSLRSILDFDESRKIDDDNVFLNKLFNQHINFINTLQRYLEFREKDKTTQVLDRFRLRMTRYLDRNSGIVNKLLSFACERRVKELNLSLEIAWNKQLDFYYCLSPISLLNGNSVTSLNLEFVRIQDIRCAGIVHTDHLLPCCIAMLVLLRWIKL